MICKLARVLILRHVRVVSIFVSLTSDWSGRKPCHAWNDKVRQVQGGERMNKRLTLPASLNPSGSKNAEAWRRETLFHTTAVYEHCQVPWTVRIGLQSWCSVGSSQTANVYRVPERTSTTVMCYVRASQFAPICSGDRGPMRVKSLPRNPMLATCSSKYHRNSE